MKTIKTMNVFLGTMNIDYPFKSDLSKEEEYEIVNRYLSLCPPGCGYLDTAYYYAKGKTHRSLCEILKRQKKENKKERVNDIPTETEVVKIATKVNPWYDNDFTSGRLGSLSSEQIRQQTIISLRDLGVEKVDIMFLHAYDYETPLEETLRTMHELYKEGTWNEWGLSNFSLKQCQEVIRLCEEKEYKKPKVYQGMYNVLCRKVEEVFPLLEKEGMCFWAYNPLCGGLVSGKKSKESGRFSNPIYQSIFWNDDMVNVCQTLNTLAHSHSMKGGGIELALCWLRDHSKLDFKRNDAILLGASTVSQFQQNWDILHSTSSDSFTCLWSEVERIVNELSTQSPHSIPNYCY